MFMIHYMLFVVFESIYCVLILRYFNAVGFGKGDIIYALT